MKTHTMHLDAEPFAKIASGTKTIESRLYDTKRQHISIGDTIVFVCREKPSHTISTTVVALYRYSTFAKLFADFPPQLFGSTSRKTLLQEIEMFYSTAKQKQHGVIGIKVALSK